MDYYGDRDDASSYRPQATNYYQNHPDSPPNRITSPLATFHHRPGYQRLSSAQEEDNLSQESRPVGVSELPEDDSVHGLRIKFSDHNEEALNFGGSSRETPDTQPGSSDFLLSPLSARSSKHGRHASLGGTSPYAVEDGSSYGRSGRSSQSSMSRLEKPFSADPEEEQLFVKRSRSSVKSFDTSALNAGEPRCKTRRHFHHPRSDYLSITILVLSVFSTVFSAIWLGVALAKPRYGRYVTNNGHLPPSTASLLTAGFAKLIELSFVTVFVTVLGQILSRRAFVKDSRGLSIAEMQMRTWVMQPGTMITHRETVRYAAWSILGAVTLTTALMAMLYTTASDALVSPKLKFGPLERRQMWGQVAARYGYEEYQEANVCQTPISNITDPNNGRTCMQIQYSGEAYHNYAQYMASWTEAIKVNNGSVDENKRPPPVAILYDNTTVQGAWVEQTNMSDLYAQYGRIVNNITMAMPLSSVFGATLDPRNDLLQPQDLDGLGEYYLEASVPSPSINVLCASMTEDDMSPMVLNHWPGFNTTNNGTAPNATNYPSLYKFPMYPDWINKTVVDDLFGFGEKYGRRMPIFPKLPIAFNTIINETTPFNTDPTDPDQVYLVDSMYILAKTNATIPSPYMLCSIRSSMYPNCSTQYYASMGGGSLTANCADDNIIPYNRFHPEATSGVWDPLWITAANAWAESISLGTGISDDNAANSRLLTQFIPTTASLDPLLPSIGEALAVMAGTVLLAFTDSPFMHYWNYTTNSPDSWYLDPPQYQAFNATLRSQDYSSGGTQHWQGIFYIVLLAIFFTNLFCLAYFIFHHGLVTDFIEPQNLFALSLNSPPSHVLDGSCGGGPEPEQLKSNWHIRLESDRDHFLIESKDEPPEVRLRRGKARERRKQWEVELQPTNSPIAEMYEKLSRKRTSTLWTRVE